MALIDTETLDQYQKFLDDEAHWLTEYAQGKGPKVGQCIINITVTMHRAAWAFRELMKERLADDSGSYDALLPSAQPEIIRCKDCAYWQREWSTEKDYHYCTMIDDRTYREFYCANAERREVTE